jgi:hypothetical protein
MFFVAGGLLCLKMLATDARIDDLALSGSFLIPFSIFATICAVIGMVFGVLAKFKPLYVGL